MTQDTTVSPRVMSHNISVFEFLFWWYVNFSTTEHCQYYYLSSSPSTGVLLDLVGLDVFDFPSLELSHHRMVMYKNKAHVIKDNFSLLRFVYSVDNWLHI